jgi:hypothetical protein
LRYDRANQRTGGQTCFHADDRLSPWDMNQAQ